ncbi:MAG: class I SAM-dependent methyltransferase [Methylophaga sp.]|nr:class I SAM-dependent methyltransferase [Methylophaga sp.]
MNPLLVIKRIFDRRQKTTEIASVPLKSIDSNEVIHCVLVIVERFTREYDVAQSRLIGKLRTMSSTEAGVEEFNKIWQEFSRDMLTTPQWTYLLFPDECSEDKELLELVKKISNISAHSKSLLTPQLEDWIRSNLDLQNTGGLFNRLLLELKNNDPTTCGSFKFLSRFHTFKDILCGYFVRPELKVVQRTIFHQCYLQRINWKQGYCFDYPYQGFDKLAVSGVKPTEERLLRYEIDSFLKNEDKVLDIGSNGGFFSLALAEKVGSIDGVEYNPYLIQIANIAKDYLGISNARFIVADFVEWIPEDKYDAVFSMANHCTIDGNLSVGFEDYIAKIFTLMKPGGILFFESHNVFGPGEGGPGDDGDLDIKFDIVEKYFEVVQHKMVKTFVPDLDVDKLFVILQRREDVQHNVQRTFNLAKAKLHYDY